VSILIGLAQVALGLLVLGVLVLVHELGHFAVAKWCGVRVLAFSIGFGRPLVRRTVGDTEYRISSIPFGGYVHMAGEHPEDAKENRPDEFQNKPVWQRALVALAGPLSNALFALAGLWVMFLLPFERPLYLDNPTIGAVSDSSAAKAAALQPGDSIVAIGGRQVRNWDDIEREFSKMEKRYDVEVVRGGQRIQAQMQMPRIKGVGLPRHPLGGIENRLPAIVGTLVEGRPAKLAGLQEGDTILALDSAPVAWFDQMQRRVSSYDTARGSMLFTVKRADGVHTITLTPVYEPALGRCVVGITPSLGPTRRVHFTVAAAVGQALHQSAADAMMIFEILGKLAERQVSPQQLAGPIGIVQMSGLVFFGGLRDILSFMGLIGVNLALLNLLPLVITDGGLLFFLLLEAVRGRPLPLKYHGVLNRVAIACFVALFLYVTYNDVLRLPLLFGLGAR
jgi:regulator of sigma E protease